MNVDEMLSGVRDAMTVKRVYGDPIERDGILVIPAAKVMGGGGGGGAAGGFAVTDPDPPPQPISHDNAKAVIAIDLVNLVTESPWYSIARHARIPHLRAPLKASRGIPVKSARCRVSLASSRS